MANPLKLVFQRKKKIFIFFLACALFTFLLFPFGDLSDKISAEIPALTQNGIQYIQFDDVSLGMIPQPALTLSSVKAETAQLELAIDELSVAPSLAGLLKQKPYGHIYGEGLYGGNLDLSVSGSSKLKDKDAVTVDLDYSSFNMKELLRGMQQNLPVVISGTGQLKAQVDLDPTMKSQPDGDITLVVSKLQIPNFSLAALGDMALPGLNMEKLQLKGNLKNGKFTINETVLGSNKDDFSGKVSGTMDMRFAPNMSGFNMGAYNLAVDITFRENLLSQLSLVMPLLDGFIGNFRQNNMGGQRYTFRIQADSFQQIPQITAL